MSTFNVFWMDSFRASCIFLTIFNINMSMVGDCFGCAVYASKINFRTNFCLLRRAF